MSTRDQQAVAETLQYCLDHCDSDDETQLVVWVAEHLASKGQAEMLSEVRALYA